MNSEMLYLYLSLLIFAVALASVFWFRDRINNGDFLFLSSVLGAFLFSMCVPPLLANLFYYQLPLSQYGTRVSREAVIVVLVLSITMFGFAIGCIISARKTSNHGRLKIISLRRPLLDLMIAVVLVIVCIYGYWSGILAVGLKPRFVLPFRLNGIIEYLMLFFLPFFLCFYSYTRKFSLLLTLLVIGIYASLNLYLTGSKWAALYPVLVSFLFFLYCGVPLSNTILFVVVAFAFYAFLNPFKFRVDLYYEEELSIVESFKQSFFSRQATGYSQLENILRGLYMLSSRFNGFFPLVWALDISKFTRGLTFDVYGYINTIMIGNSSIGTGMFGFFVIFFGSPVLGVMMALVVLFFLYRVNHLLAVSNRMVFGPVAFCASMMSLVLLGRVQFLGTYLGIALTIVLVLWLERWYGVSRVEN